MQGRSQERFQGRGAVRAQGPAKGMAQQKRSSRRRTLCPYILMALYTLDRLLKLLAVHRFLRRSAPPAPAQWPGVSLLQPITRGAADLPGALACRAALRYTGHIQHVLICDEGDGETIALCRAWAADHPGLDVRIVTAEGAAERHRVSLRNSVSGVASAPIATKVEKLHAGLPYAVGEVLAFVDDDILLRAEAVEQAVRYLQEPRAGAVFGVAVYTDWRNVPSSLLSAFVNANALLSYLPLTYLAEPWTITGHFYALRRQVFDAVGGLGGMEGRFDDDHELARRVMRHGLRNVQTPVIYDVDNRLDTLHDYANQLRRWFIIPKQTMAPYLTPRQQTVALLGSAGNLLLPLLAALTVAGRASPRPLLGSLALFAAVYAWCERRYLGRRTPPRRWPLVLLSALIAPLEALAALVGGDTFDWRGRRIRLHRGGRFEVLTPYGQSSTPVDPRR